VQLTCEINVGMLEALTAYALTYRTGTTESMDLSLSNWIPCRDLAGRARRLSLRDILVEAHELRAIEHHIPIVEAGLQRLMIALALDIFHPKTMSELADLLKLGRFNTSDIDEYFIRYADHFSLFSSTRPFLQDAAAGGAEKPIAALLPSRPSGTNAVHWNHGHESDFAVTPGEAALLLTTIAPFMTAGGAGLSPSINGAPPWYVMIAAETLFETTALNLWVHHPNIKRGAPAWRRTTPLQTETRQSSASLLQGLTWMPRRIRLIPGAGGRSSLSGEESPVLVHAMYFTAGEACDFGYPTWIDPNVAYVISKDKTNPLRPREDRDPWRDVGALALLEEQSGGDIRHVRPAIVSQFARMAADGLLARTELRLRLYGMRTDLKMKIFEWYRQSLELPVPLVLRSEIHLRLLAAEDQAEGIQWNIKRSLELAVTPANHTPKSEAKALILAACTIFWAAMEQPFLDLANALGTTNPAEFAPADAAIVSWRRMLGDAANHAFNVATAELRLDAMSLIAIERGRDLLQRAIRRLTPSVAPQSESTVSNSRSSISSSQPISTARGTTRTRSSQRSDS